MDEPPKKSFLIAVLLVLLCFFVVSTSIFAYKYYRVKQQIDQTQIIPSPTSPSNPNPTADVTCQYNGKIYQDGEVFPDKCNSCTCESGQIACTAMACE